MTQVFELNLISRHFADFICKESSGKAPVLRYAASLASWAVENGDICFNLTDIAGMKVQIDGEKYKIPAIAELKAFLHETPVVGFPFDYKPLVLDEEGRLYLYRYWKYEQNLARIISEKTKKECQNIDKALLENGLDRLFPCDDVFETDWQRVAALAAVLKPFCIISGGPGTGKTYTVVKIIALLLEQEKSRSLRIALAAPTGKSAARLKDSINLMKDSLNCGESIKEQIPPEVSTIHRLLGITGSGQVRYSDRNLLPYDVIVVDEASMVSLPLMAKLAIAIRQDSRLILIGDRHQLASVEAGSVLGDICVGASDSLVILRKNYRFRDKSGLNIVGQLVNSGNGAKAVDLLKNDTYPDLIWRDAPKPDGLRKALVALTHEAFGAYFASQNAAEALKLFDSFRVLCALRHGPYGVIEINSIIEEILEEKGLIDLRNRWYRGRPVIITVNDYNLKLFNGDIGVTFPDHESGGSPRVFFQAHDGGVRKFSPVRLPAHETVYAMTIHKSQGSEFDRVLMLLPPQDLQILTRELIYTGITRARKEVHIWADEHVFVNSVSRRIDRKSGLRDTLVKS